MRQPGPHTGSNGLSGIGIGRIHLFCGVKKARSEDRACDHQQLGVRQSYLEATNFHPLRNFGFRYSFASLLFVKRIFSASHISLPSNFIEMTPSSIHCTNGPAILKFEQDGSPPFAARIQSR